MRPTSRSRGGAAAPDRRTPARGLGRGPAGLRRRRRGARDPQRLAGTRSRSLEGPLPELFGGAADLSESNLTDLKGEGELQRRPRAGRNIRFGVREHAMGGIANGIAYHGGLLPVRRDVPDLQRLHARLGAPRGAHRAARRCTSGPTTRSASARTAPPTSRSSTTRRCARCPGLRSCGPATRTRPVAAWRARRRAARRADGARAHAPEAAGPAGHRGARARRRACVAATCWRTPTDADGDAGRAGRHPHRDRLGAAPRGRGPRRS